MSHSGFCFIGPLWLMTKPRSTGIMREDGDDVCGCSFSDGGDRFGDNVKPQNKSQDVVIKITHAFRFCGGNMDACINLSCMFF